MPEVLSRRRPVHDKCPDVRQFFLPQTRAFGAAGPVFWQAPKSSPVPYTRVFGALMPIYNVHFMYGWVFGCRKLLRVVFAHVRESLIGNITKLPGCNFGRDVVLAKRDFWRNSYRTPGFLAR